MLRVRRVGLAFFMFTIICSAFFTTPAQAQTPRSTNFRLDETNIGSGGLVQSSSASYQMRDSLSDIGVGNAASENFQVDVGSVTPHEPTLTVVVNSAQANFGKFSPNTTATATASFSVINYTTYGYVVQISGSPFKSGDHTIPAMSITGESQTGIEQFGMNLVANTQPTSLGANVDNGGFGFGSVEDNYNTPNRYRFVNNEFIASAPKDSGKSIYTISYIANVEGLTPGGIYRSNQTIVVTGTY